MWLFFDISLFSNGQNNWHDIKQSRVTRHQTQLRFLKAINPAILSLSSVASSSFLVNFLSSNACQCPHYTKDKLKARHSASQFHFKIVIDWRLSIPLFKIKIFKINCIRLTNMSLLNDIVASNLFVFKVVVFLRLWTWPANWANTNTLFQMIMVKLLLLIPFYISTPKTADYYSLLPQKVASLLGNVAPSLHHFLCLPNFFVSSSEFSFNLSPSDFSWFDTLVDLVKQESNSDSSICTYTVLTFIWKF